MISDNAIPHCELELGCCSRQIPYNLVAHDKMIHDKSYQQGRADAIEELLSKCEQYNYTCNSREFARIIREQLKEAEE